MKSHQGGECSDCAGEGLVDADNDYENEDSGPLTTCKTCEGSGLANWSWDEDDVSHCDMCDAPDDVPVTAWDEDGENGQCTYICEPCARQMHKRMCGCGDDGWRVEP